MRKSLTFLEDPRRYYDERKDPTLTLQGINQLLLNDNHPVSAQYMKLVCDAVAPTIADGVMKRLKRAPSKSQIKKRAPSSSKNK